MTSNVRSRGPNRASDSLLQVTQIQTTAGDFDGTTGKGLFPTYMARRLVGVLVKSDTKMSLIKVNLCMPNPADPTGATDVEYPWVELCNETYTTINDQWPLPRASKVKIYTTGGTNVTAQLIYGLLQEAC